MKKYKEIIVFRDEEPIYSVPVPFHESLINKTKRDLLNEFKGQYPRDEITVSIETPKFFGW